VTSSHYKADSHSKIQVRTENVFLESVLSSLVVVVVVYFDVKTQTKNIEAVIDR
jgi:hypothetical protein